MESSTVTKLFILFHLISQLLLKLHLIKICKDNIFEEYFISVKSVPFFLNEGTSTLTSSVLDLSVILKLNNFQCVEKALNCFMELKF